MTNKRRLTVLLALLMVIMLCGCCLKHDYAPATCTEPETCTKCGKTEGEPLGHTEVVDEAVATTCTETGLTQGSHCSVCGETLKKQEIIPALGHTEGVDAGVEATCTETGLTEGSHCSVCGEVLKEQKEIPAKGHTEVTDEALKPTCSRTGLTEGSHCSECGEVFVEQKEIPALGHTGVLDAAVEPTCTETGLTEGSHCSTCGEIFVRQEEIPALGHTEVTDEAVEPTCTESGLTEGFHCSACGEVLVKQETIPTLGHTEVIDEAVAATCTETGLTEGKRCSACGEVLVKQETISALGHTEVTDEAVAPTCTETGLTEGTHCSVCGEIFTAQEEIPAAGHSWKPVGFYKPMVCTDCGAESKGDAGYEFFLGVLDSIFEKSEPATKRFSEPILGKAFPEAAKHITLTADGLDSIIPSDAFLSESELTIVLNSDPESGIIAKLELSIPSIEKYTAYLTYDEEGRLGLMLPEFSDEYYLADSSAVEELICEYSENSKTFKLYFAALADIMKQESLRDTIYRYADILFSIANYHNTSEEEKELHLEALDETVECTVVKLTPSRSDWAAMLRRFAETASTDDVLMQYFKLIAGYEYDTDSYYQRFYTRDEYVEEFAEEFLDELYDIKTYATDYAEDLVGFYLVVAYEGSRVHAIRLCDYYDDGLEYESFGDVSESREDVLMQSQSGRLFTLALNTIKKASNKSTGKLSIPRGGIQFSYVLTEDPETGKLQAADTRLTADGTEINTVIKKSDGETDISFTLDQYDGTALSMGVNAADSDESVMLPEHVDRGVSSWEDFALVMNGISATDVTVAPVPGSIVTFGRYEQDNVFFNGKEDIEWIVLDQDGDKSFLISLKGLDCKPYNTEWIAVTWETCSLRRWLNDDFYNNAFSAEEQALICSTLVSADENMRFWTDPGNPTEDKIFILSAEEADLYFNSDDERECQTTEYAKANGVYYSTFDEDLDCSWWWLRTPGESSDSAATVACYGEIDREGDEVVCSVDSVRPAMWISNSVLASTKEDNDSETAPETSFKDVARLAEYVNSASTDGNRVISNITVPGLFGDINLIAGVDPDGKIDEITCVSHNETPGLGGPQLTDEALTYLIGKNSPDDVDVVSGASTTSGAIQKAVAAAFEQFAIVKPASAASDIKVGIAVPDVTHGWVAGVAYYAEKYCKDNDLTYKTVTSSDAAEMQAGLQDLVAWGANVIVSYPQWAGMETAIEEVIQAGIPVVNFDVDVKCDGVYMVTGDNYDMGYQSAKYITGIVGDAANIVVMDVPSSGSICELRKQGFYDYLKEINYDTSNIFEIQEAAFSNADGLKDMADVLEAHPQIDAVYSMDDETSLGAIQAITEAGRTDIKAITGGGGCQNYFKVIASDEGKAVGAASALYSPMMICNAIENAIALYNGETVEQKMIIPTTIISAENVEFYLDPENTIY